MFFFGVGNASQVGYTSGLLFRWMFVPERLILIVAALICIGLGLSAPAAESKCILFFSPVLQLGPQVSSADREVADSAAHSPPPQALEWADDLLTGKQAIDAVCKRVERSVVENRAGVLRSACLLLEPGRIRVEPLPNDCVSLRVTAEDARTAQILCESLVAYLKYQTKIPLEDPEGDTLSKLEQDLRKDERSLSQFYWQKLAFTAIRGPAPKGPGEEPDSEDYAAKLAKYHQMMREHFFREPHLAAQSIHFEVISPPEAHPAGRPRWLLAAGLVLGVLVFSLLPLRGQARKPRVLAEKGTHSTAGQAST